MRMIWSLVFLAPLFWLTMGEMMAASAAGLYANGGAPVFPAAAQLVLTLVVVVLNREYFINRFRELIPP
jgi:hypothetical protein